ncbi:helix-turn-helix transcriptional regulator [Sphingobacterium sp. SRCM116780]|uniref:helix-turn-helix domain-containing protein n=1 Tax=Sphingobacterium sp. SRCM116780 TaxID=2907623 RepID=UPI001F2B7FC7|nr:AraC family transcriptional regulator [Sphingobacterium sp. SRCM116780]UIR57594.1 helix-turn-helix transcriptional regulator [Sphingobacterium sp. SRCM116780]
MSSENLQDFYHRLQIQIPGEKDYPLKNADYGHISVFSRGHCKPTTPYIKRDFFKISLIIGRGELHYAERWIKIDRPALLFSNPMIPYSWENVQHDQNGWFCVFDNDFINSNGNSHIFKESRLMDVSENPIYFLTDDQVKSLNSLFMKIDDTLQSDYAFRFDLARTYIELLVHEGLKLKPVEVYEIGNKASSRISHLFLELLERQFPIQNQEGLLLKNPADFAAQLFIHPNHLNKALKEETGKTTSELIAERTTREAQRLLKQTDWQIAEIAYALGFEYPSYFNNFIKKRTQRTPMQLRQTV